MDYFYRIPLLLALGVTASLLIATEVNATDCNNNGIEDTLELATCPEIDLVFIIDTSNSMDQELEPLCEDIDGPEGVLAQLAEAGLTVNAEIRAMAPGGAGCPCCTDTVANVYGTKAPCLPEVLGTCGGCNEGDCEDWGPATAIVAANRWWKWGPGPRIIIPISDEAPRCGSPINDPGDDRDAIDHAIYLVWDNHVIVSPVVDSGLIRPLAEAFVSGGAPGGHVFDITDVDLADKLADHIRSTCPEDCNGNGVIDSCDIIDGSSPDCFAYQSDCCIPRAGPGCDDTATADCVCKDPPEGYGFSDCCDVEWTEFCATAAVALCTATCDAVPDGVPDECQPSPDCNGNETKDAIDIATGASLDCNENCIPDECDLESGTSHDCNANGLLDECDIVDATSCDVDGNGIPDECITCCLSELICENLVEDTCVERDGEPGGQGSCYVDACVNGACCIGEACTPERPKVVCEDQGGYYAGPGVSCSPPGNPCLTGACCTGPDQEECIDEIDDQDVTKADCEGVSPYATYIGGADCDADPCAGPPGPTVDAPDPDPGLPDQGHGTRNRYLSFVPGNAGQLTALRVTLTASALFPGDVGMQWWVGEPFLVSEAAGSTGSTPTPAFTAAFLESDPYYRDWATLCPIHVSACEIVPSSTYEVQAIHTCWPTELEESYSTPLSIVMGMWGDIGGDHYKDPADCVVYGGRYTDCFSLPNGEVDFDDINALVDKFRNLFGAVQKSRGEIAGDPPVGIPDQLVNFVDISYAVNAFRGLPYPFPGPEGCE